VIVATAPRPDWVTRLVADSASAGQDVPALLLLARDFGACLPRPGQGETALRWQILAELATANLSAARVFEAHTDALAIIAEAGESAPAGTYGVFAAEAPDCRLEAEPSGGLFRLTGTKPWCSLGSVLDRGLVTAHTGTGRQLFLVDLHDRTVTAEPTKDWIARGLPTITSTSLTFNATPAMPIGDVGWYLHRSGFAWGGIGVAACWFGGARGLQQRLRVAAASRADDLAHLSVGTVDAALHAAAVTLDTAAAAIDRGDAAGPAGELLALRARAVVVDAAERTLRVVAHALGPAPLAFEEEHARRVADLELYLRQHHDERDLAALGRASLMASAP
jgi:alkylation response protein AidB-like acyl-CoA dehydrogenase